jgi:DNA polymerase-3 subunit gamma/tau
MCYVNSVLTIDAESSKKKLSESVKTEVSASKNVEKAPNTEQTTEKPVAKAEPAKPAVESKPVTRSVPPVSIGKTRKVITLDSLDDITDEPVQKLLVTDTEEEEVYTGSLINLTAESLVTIWDEYAAKLPDTKKGLRLALAKYRPEFNQDNKGLLTLKVQSDIQKNQFEEVRYGIQSFISQRTGLQVELEIIADKKIDTGAKPYTPKEKFERLLEKNPALKTMQQRFGLELDYD